MRSTFIPIAAQHYRDFFQAFQSEARKEPCRNCDGLCRTKHGFSTTVCLLPGELEFLSEVGLHLKQTLDPISTPCGTIYCWNPAATCPQLRNDHSSLGKEPQIKPVEWTIFPLIFNRHGSDEFGVSPSCQHAAAFLQNGFIAKARVAMGVYLLPYLDKAWLRYRNELNLAIDENCYHRLKKEKAGQPITIKEFKECATEV